MSDVLAKQKPGEPHPRSTCKVASHQSQGRLVKPSEKVSGTYIMDQEAVRLEEQLAGVRFYRTTVLDWGAATAHDAYQALQAVEANHRLEKGPLRLQPCYHRKTSRIEAHVMLNILTVNCIRHLERLTGASYQQLVDLFKPLKAAQFDAGDRIYWQRTELTDDQVAILEKLQIEVPPTSWSTWIEVKRGKPNAKKNGPSSRKSRSR